MNMNMKDKVVLITGGSGGIGLTCVKTYIERGAKVAIIDLEGKRLNEIDNSYPDVKCFALNLIEVNKMEAVVEDVLKEFGKIDILVQVAGLMKSADSFHIDEKSWNMMFDINARATFFMAKMVVEKYMKNHGGVIVNFASAAAIRGFYGTMASPHYGASKAAIISLTQQLAVEWGQFGIRVNAVVPGGVMTEAMKKLEFKENLFDNIPLKKLSEPQDIANVVAFLTSDESAMITGQAIVIDGGASIVGQ